MTEVEIKKAMRMIVLTASIGGMSYLSFNNGLLIAYFSYLNIPSATILLLLALMPLAQFVFMLPFSFLSDILGKKFIGNIGLFSSLFGYVLLIIASILPENFYTLLIGTGIVLFGIGSAMTLGNWFALLHPIIPEKVRGRFFGRLRLTWQSIGIILTFLGGFVITYNASNFEFRGSLYAIISAFGYSCLFMIVKKMGRNLNMMMVSVLRSVGVSLLIGIYLLCFNKFQLPSSIDLLYMFIGGTCGAYVGKAFQFQAIKLVDISRTTAITPLEAVFVLILTYIFFETVPSTIKLIGGAIILVGVLTLIIFSRRKQN